VESIVASRILSQLFTLTTGQVALCARACGHDEENHAHDIYDAFHAIHKTAVVRNTFFHWEELIDIIRESHGKSLRFERLWRKKN
jgi:hypothetical protein